jgi:hypothetical protein
MEGIGIILHVRYPAHKRLPKKEFMAVKNSGNYDTFDPKRRVVIKDARSH